MNPRPPAILLPFQALQSRRSSGLIYGPSGPENFVDAYICFIESVINCPVPGFACTRFSRGYNLMNAENRKPVRIRASRYDSHTAKGACIALILLTPVNISIVLFMYLYFHYNSQSSLLFNSYIIGASLSCSIAGLVILTERKARARAKTEVRNAIRKESILCSVCGALVPHGETSCPVCRSRLLKTCSSCGLLSAMNVKNCPRCGNQL